FAQKRYPDYVTIAKGYGCGAASVSKKSDLTGALEEMIQYPGPFVLDVEVPYQAHVLPMIPSDGTIHDVIRE
ncbi:MAG TPA: thiamine pyrophosphate-dependent enzyme, partial [Pirellulales bacterium]|nr:thiamine pyrophosphate-dependent enzyme [Pirellulales bacterium]